MIPSERNVEKQHRDSKYAGVGVQVMVRRVRDVWRERARRTAWVSVAILLALLLDGAEAWHASFGKGTAPQEQATSSVVPFDIPRPRVDGEQGDLAISRCEVAEGSLRKALAVCDSSNSCNTKQR
jgi:hypothetical protein